MVGMRVVSVPEGRVGRVRVVGGGDGDWMMPIWHFGLGRWFGLVGDRGSSSLKAGVVVDGHEGCHCAEGQRRAAGCAWWMAG